ncbi:IclR family transcriptional regulator [Sphingopyxis sp. 22461]|uniref:IclR family transcriptional regulator n=1 Tax=Sphingopyxis sp. 22461 TaxID=3453923 RepID=UPI003F8455AB
MTSTGLQAGVKSALRTLDVIEFVVASPSGVVAQDIAAALAIPVSSLSYLLATLVERGYLRRDGRQYVAGQGLERLRGANGEYSLLDRARPLVKALQLRLNETATLFRLVDWEVEAVFSETTPQPLRYAIEVGTRAPLYCVAAGKALLARMSDAQLQQYFAKVKPERFTEATICDRKALRDEIAGVRDQGIAAARNEYTSGITAFSIALSDDTAISVAAPSLRMDTETEMRIMELLRGTARALQTDNRA